MSRTAFSGYGCCSIVRSKGRQGRTVIVWILIIMLGNANGAAIYLRFAGVCGAMVRFQRPARFRSRQLCPREPAVIKGLVILVLLGALTPLQGASGDGQEVTVRFPVYLNHFYLTLDHATYSAIKNDLFLRGQFAVSEERTTVRKDRTYTGLYFYGNNTYFEFFDVDTEKQRRVGDSAIAFGVDEAGASGKLEGPLGTHSATITRQLGEADVPWFLMTTPKGFTLESGISTWVMEYHPRFLREWHGEATGDAGVSRREILSRYKAVLKGAPARLYLADVVGVTIAADKQVTARMTELCKVFGYSSRVEAGDTVLHGPDFDLRLAPGAESAHGIQQVLLRLSRTPTTNAELRFGSKSVLKFHPDATATWAF